MKTRQLRRQAITDLQQAGIESAIIDTDVLLMHCWNKDRKDLILLADATVPPPIVQTFHKLIRRRLKHEPVAYLTGHKEFWSLDFEVNQHVLIPRPETEHIIEHVLQLFPDRQFPWKFCDIGTGSGCIAVSMAREYPNASIIASDVSTEALKLARKNARKHQTEQQIHFVLSDVLDQFKPCWGPFHLIVSNPPYISEEAMDALATDLSFEPRSALTDGDDGLSIMRKLIHQAPSWLLPGHHMIIESGLAGLPEETGDFQCRSYYDLADQFRGGIYTLNPQL